MRQDRCKRVISRFLMPVLLGLSVGMAGNALAGWKIVERGEGATTTYYVDGNRVVSSEGDGMRIVIDGETMTMIADQSRSYWSGTTEAFRTSMCAYVREVWEMAGYRPKPVAAPLVRVEKAGSEKVAGYQADRYRVLADGKLFQEVWRSRDSRLRELEATWGRVQAFEFSGDTCGEPTSREEAIVASRPYRRLMAGGLVLKSSNPPVFGKTTSTEVVSIERQPVPAERFRVPAGYRRVKSVEALMRQASGGEEEREERPSGFSGGQPPAGMPPGMGSAAAAAAAGEEVETRRPPEPPPDEDAGRDEDTGGVEGGLQKIKEGVGGLLKSLF